MRRVNLSPGLLGVAVATLCAMPLSGCALMGGGGKPQTMFAFGASAPAAAPEAVPTRAVTILYPGAVFYRPSAGVRILTERGNEVAYVAKARWVAPAPELFDAAAIRSIEGVVPSARIVGMRDRPRSDYLLAVEVRRFAAVYSGQDKAPPDAVVEARAKLVRISDRAILGDWEVVHQEAARENRVTEIVYALDRSTQAIVTDIARRTREAMAGGNGA